MPVDVYGRLSVGGDNVIRARGSVGTVFPGSGTKDYNKLKNKPLTLDEDKEGYDGVEGLVYRLWELLDHPEFADVSYSGEYGDLLNTPDLSKKQDTLVSGVNIKTINGKTVLGSGDLKIKEGGTVDQTYNATSHNAQSGTAVAGAIAPVQATADQANTTAQEAKTGLTNKQDTLVSGANIKTINNETLLGSGNIDIDSDSTYEYSQLVPASEWRVTHNLNKYPSVTVVDSGGSVVIGDIEYIDTNNVIMTFRGAFSGKAYFN